MDFLGGAIFSVLSEDLVKKSEPIRQNIETLFEDRNRNTKATRACLR